MGFADIPLVSIGFSGIGGEYQSEMAGYDNPGFPKWCVTNRQRFDSKEPIKTVDASSDCHKLQNQMGESKKYAF